MINPGKAFNINDYKEIFLRRVWYFVIPFVVILVGTGIYAIIVPKEYRASTLILVTPQKVPENFVRPTVTSRIEDRLQSIGQEIMSRTRLEQVIKEFNLYQEEGKSLRLEEVVSVMQKNIQVQIKGKEGGYFTISYIGKDPKTVTLVTNKLASLFIEENLKLREQQAQGTSEFLGIELNSTKAKLEEQEKLLAGFKRKFLGELPEQRDANLRVLDNLQAQFQRVGDGLRAAQDRKLMLEKNLAEVQVVLAAERASVEEEDVDEQGLTPSEKKDPRLAKIAQLKNHMEDLRMKYTEKHPDLLIINKKIVELEKEVEMEKMTKEDEIWKGGQETYAGPTKPVPAGGLKGKKKDRTAGSRAGVDPRVKEVKDRILLVDKEMERLREEDSKVKAQIVKYQSRVEKTFEREQDMYIIARDYNNTRDAYSSLLKKSQEAQQAENLERRQKGEQFRIIDPARIPEMPYRPDLAKIFLVGLLLGLACGAASAFFREQMDRSFRDAEDLQVTFGLKVLANIPRVEGKTS